MRAFEAEARAIKDSRGELGEAPRLRLEALKLSPVVLLAMQHGCKALTLALRVPQVANHN